MALQAAYRAFTDPESVIRNLSQVDRIAFYEMAWKYYRNEMYAYKPGTDWTLWLSERRLYKKMTLHFNPAPQIAGFHEDNIWQKAANPRYESLVTPLADSTDEKLVAANAQLDQWGNAQSEFQIIKRYAAVTGNVLVEGVDDLDREKVTHKTIWPAYVKEIQLSAGGDVLSYTLEYNVTDPIAKKDYRYKKVVTKESFSYFRDDKPFVPEGRKTAIEENPYGFVFAVWIKHSDDGASYGLPACKDFNKIDRVNSLASHMYGYIHKAIESPKVISTKGEIIPIIGATRSADGTVTEQDPELNWMVLKTEEGASVHDLSGLLDLTAASPELDRLLKSFTDDYPELQASSIIRENSQLSGAALERMLGPAQNRLDGVQAGYNQQLIKFRQMGIAAGGMRYKNGDWSRNEQQKAFAPYGLDSYKAGDLNFYLKRSVLVQNTEAENEDLRAKKLGNAKLAKELGLPVNEQLKLIDKNEDEIAELEPLMLAAAEESVGFKGYLNE